MNNKRDCFNNRSKNQPVFLSRADRAATWRGRGMNNRLNTKTERNMTTPNNENLLPRMGYKLLERESAWNSIPNPIHSQQNIVSYIDNNLEFQVNPLRTPTRAPPGITPLYDIPCVPSSSNRWSAMVKYGTTLRPSTANVLPERRVVIRSVLENNENYQPQKIKDFYLHNNNRDYEYKSASSSQQSLSTSGSHHWMPLQSIENNHTQRQNSMCSGHCQPAVEQRREESTWNKSKAPVTPIGTCSSSSCLPTATKTKTATPLSWSQVVSRSSSCSTGRNEPPSFKREPSPEVEYAILASPTPSEAFLPCSTLSSKSLQSSYAGHRNMVHLSDTNPSQTMRYISDSFAFMLSPLVRFSEVPETRPFIVLRIANIPWSISSDDISNLIRQNRCIASPGLTELPQSIHIIMDPQTGKTCGEAFVEVKLLRKRDINAVICQLSTYPVQGRHLRFTLSSYDELRRRLFSHWSGTFQHNVATPHQDENANQSNPSVLFIGQKELQGLLNVCRNYKVFYNRKCPERSFEYLISITLNIPWLQKKCVTTIQRDILYECYKLVAEALKIHIHKTLHLFESTLMTRLIRTALTCDGFTIKQKQVILNNSQIDCPSDLVEYLVDNRETPPPEQMAIDGVLKSIMN